MVGKSSGEEAFNSLRFRREEDLNVTGVTLRTQNSGEGWKKPFEHNVRVVGDGGASLHSRMTLSNIITFCVDLFIASEASRRARGPERMLDILGRRQPSSLCGQFPFTLLRSVSVGHVSPVPEIENLIWACPNRPFSPSLPIRSDRELLFRTQRTPLSEIHLEQPPTSPQIDPH